jgi:hypothetical protein
VVSYIHQSWQEVSRAFATEDVATPGKNRARLNVVLSREKTTCGLEPLRPKKYPRTAPLELFPFTARGNDRDAEFIVSKMKYPHPTPPVTVNEKVCFQIAVGFSRGSTLLRSCDDRKKPAACQRKISRWPHLVTGLGCMGHSFFLCSQYSATGRFQLARDN